jgi:hypothetical protein
MGDRQAAGGRGREIGGGTVKFRLPANVDMPDRIFAGLTIRQLAILGGDALLIWLLFLAVGGLFHPILFASVSVPFAAAGLALATSTPEGIGLDRFAAFAGRYFLRPKPLVFAPEGLAFASQKKRLAPIQVPIRDFSDDGLLDLGPEGFAIVCRASGVNLTLRSEREQVALTEALGRFLNSLDGPIQILVISRRIDLSTLLRDMNTGATSLPNPSLQRAAQEHVRYMSQLAVKRDARRREVLVCLREPRVSRDDAAIRLQRRVDQAVDLLRAIGVTLKRLSAGETSQFLRACADPETPQTPVGCDLSSSAVLGVAQ